jgi:hypothetical protein
MASTVAWWPGRVKAAPQWPVWPPPVTPRPAGLPGPEGGAPSVRR